jgi:hypothetical protein
VIMKTSHGPPGGLSMLLARMAVSEEVLTGA